MSIQHVTYKFVFFSLGVTEAYLEKIANSEWSYVALASACYKLASPARYTVTVGASTFAVKYLKVRNPRAITIIICLVYQVYHVGMGISKDIEGSRTGFQSENRQC